VLDKITQQGRGNAANTTGLVNQSPWICRHLILLINIIPADKNGHFSGSKAPVPLFQKKGDKPGK
jgi:hypothetical protein